MNRRARPRRPIRMSEGEQKLIFKSLLRMMSDSRQTNAMSEREYQAGLALISYLNADGRLYKLGLSPLIEQDRG